MQVSGADTVYAASNVERRLVRRVMKYWEAMAGDRDFPTLDEISPEVMGEDWEWCFVLDLKDTPPFPVFKYLGPRLAKFSGVFLSGKNDWTSTVLDKATTRMGDVVKTRDKVLIEEDLKLYNGERLLFRCILLPLAEEGHEVTFILGAANGKLEPAPV